MANDPPLLQVTAVMVKGDLAGYGLEGEAYARLVSSLQSKSKSSLALALALALALTLALALARTLALVLALALALGEPLRPPRRRHFACPRPPRPRGARQGHSQAGEIEPLLSTHVSTGLHLSPILVAFFS